MRRRLILSAPLASVVAAATAGPLAGCGRAAGSRRTEVRLGDSVAKPNPEIASERVFGERLAALTNQAYEVKIFPNGILGDANQMNEQVRKGTLHMAKSLMGMLTEFDKSLGVLSLPYAFPTQQDLFTALAGGLGSAVARILLRYDLKVLAYFDSGERNVYNRKRPIRVPDDLKGLRLRVPQDAIAIDTFNALGAQTTPLSTNVSFSALHQGVVDGAENNPIFYVTSRHVEEAKYFSWTRHQFGIDALMVNRKWFEDQPAKYRDAIVQAGMEAESDERARWRTETDNYVKQAEWQGARVNDDVDIAAFQQAVKPVLDRNRADLGDLVRYLPLA